MSEASLPDSATIVTLSYRGDFEVCRLLCESVDRFAPKNFVHRLYVPTRDLALFAPLANQRRIVGSQDRDLLPRWMWKLPLPSPRVRALLRLPRRNVYLSLYSKPVRGWIAQQMMKIAATADSPTEVVIHADSETLFIRPLSMDQLVRPDGKALLYQNSGKVKDEGHGAWREGANRLLGLPPGSIHTDDFINSLVVWRRSTVRRLIARLEQVGGRDWRKILAATPNLSEYTLYGVFANAVLGLDAAGHWPDPRPLCHTFWDERFESAEAERAFVESVRPDQIACLLQSTMSLGPDARQAVLDRVLAQAARQDAAA
ncbi:DUF6492 family protein [Rhodoblastus sp.]|uniref:DUF6492 family protein n=1 Tax=Rhodoblastus sp. TaxID=1962975 RepID=UPI003F99B301